MCYFVCIVYLWLFFFFFVFNQKTAYEMRISDWSSDVCSSDLDDCALGRRGQVIQRHDDVPAVHLPLVDLLRAVIEAARVAEADGVRGREQAEKIGRASCRERVCQYV